MSFLSQICRYRELRQKRDAGVSIGMDDILAIEALGVWLRTKARETGRGSIPALLTTNTIEHALTVLRIGPDSVVCSGCPGVLPGSSFGLRLDDLDEKRSYLYRASVSRVDRVASERDSQVEFTFIGRPVVLRWGRGRSTAPEAVVELESKLCAA